MLVLTAYTMIADTHTFHPVPSNITSIIYKESL